MNRNDLVVGQYVRIKRSNNHGIRFGALCTVEDTDTGWDDIKVHGPIDPNWQGNYAGRPVGYMFVDPTEILPAKQANKKS